MASPVETRTATRSNLTTHGIWFGCQYGGIGILFPEVLMPGKRYIPAAVLQAQGLVTAPDAVLCDDTKWCWLGNPDCFATFHHPELADERHGLELSLRKG